MTERSAGIAFLAGQIYLVARLALKLQFLASQTALFQSSLAHAGYAAAPVAEWPESPSAELIARGSSSRRLLLYTENFLL